MHNKIKMITFVSFIWLFGNCTSSIKNKTRDNVNWKETVGYFVPRNYGNTGNGYLYYSVDGNCYHTRFWRQNNYVKSGENYTLRYNVNDPGEALVDYWNPVFMPDEKTVFIAASVTAIHKKRFWHPTPTINYRFEVNGKKYERKFMYLPFDYEQRYPNLKVGNQYLLECLLFTRGTDTLLNLERIAIRLDKPILSKE